jgi:hypothetical protein
VQFQPGVIGKQFGVVFSLPRNWIVIDEGSDPQPCHSDSASRILAHDCAQI